MTIDARALTYFAIMAGLLLFVGFFQSWNVSLSILNLCLISAIMALGVNIQWGYAGLFNAGIMGFAALGGLAAVVVSMPAVPEAISAGGGLIALSFGIAALTIALAVVAFKKLPNTKMRSALIVAIIVIGYFATRYFFVPGTAAVEAVEPARTGYLGGFGLPVVFSWLVGGAFAGIAAWLIGKITLGLRSDYLAIATLGISEIIVAIIKNEDWMSRGVKNVIGIPRPVPYEIDLQQSEWFQNLVTSLGADLVTFSSVFVKLCYAGLFSIVLLICIWLAQRALNSPWGRMMRAIRDNEVSANAMGKDVTGRHLQVFVLGTIIVGIAGAMLTTLDGQLTPSSYQPLRFTFLVWVMVIVGGSGNNWGAVLGGFLVWFFWTEAPIVGLWLLEIITSPLADDNALRLHLLNSAAFMRLITMGLLLLVVLRFSPRGLLPEKSARK